MIRFTGFIEKEGNKNGYQKEECLIVSTLAMIIAIVVMGPLDCFTHVFLPQKPHMVGFEIYIVNQPEDNTGTFRLTIIDSRGNEIDCIDSDLSEVKVASWYKVYASAS